MLKPSFLASLLLAAALAASTEVAALAQRTFVASDGLDTNACSVTAPCRTFATAISNTVLSGEVIVLDSAGYGPVTITQSVSITAPPGVYAGIFVPAGIKGVTINGGGIIVALRGLTINGQGTGGGGIDFKQGSRLTVENCLINAINSSGILLEAPNSRVFITDATVRYSAPGIAITDGEVTIDRVHLENNTSGLRIDTVSIVPVVAMVRDSVASENVVAGFLVATEATQTARLVVERSIATRSTYGFTVDGSGTSSIIIRDSSAVENSQSGIVANASGGSVDVVVTGTNSSRNGTYGLEQSGAAVLSTLQNNTVELNVLGSTLGTITKVTLQ